jgi:hypothetical protein
MNLTGLRPFCVRFMQIWPLITVKGGGFKRESAPSRRERPRKGLEQGVACMELRRIPGDPRINPARRGGGREASRGWKGMRPE